MSYFAMASVAWPKAPRRREGGCIGRGTRLGVGLVDASTTWSRLPKNVCAKRSALLTKGAEARQALVVVTTTRTGKGFRKAATASQTGSGAEFSNNNAAPQS